jgi:hypothetical protein
MLNNEDFVEADLNRNKLLSHKVHEYRIELAWKRFENAGFKPILIKGWAAARLYPNPSERSFNDIDLVIDPDEYNRAKKIVGRIEYTSSVDLHRGIRRLDTLSYENLYTNSVTAKCGDTEIRILRPEDHLRVLCVHWLSNGGAQKERLWDIYYAVNNRPTDFDWNRCLNTVSETRRRWIICTIGLAHRYLDLDLQDTPIALESRDLPKWFIKTVEREWKSGFRIRSLHHCLNDRKMLFEQIKKRFPPNPIMATIDIEGNFDARTRIFYQIGDFFYRLKPSLRRFSKLFTKKFKENHEEPRTHNSFD